MQLIKRIITWIINLFKRLFTKNKIKKNKSSHDKKKNNNKSNIKVTNNIIDDTLPTYMFISNSNKELLINKLKNVRKLIKQNKEIKIEKEVAVIISMITDNQINNDTEIKRRIIDLENSIKKALLNNDTDIFMDLVVNLSNKNKETVITKYNDYYKDNVEIDNSLKMIDDRIDYIEKNEISFVENDILDNMSDYLLKDISSIDNLSKKVFEYNKNILYVMENINKNIVDEVMTKYKKVNYVTLSTMLIDEIETKLQKIDNNYQSHRYNKNYYEREINNIRKQIKNIKDLKNNSLVDKEIIKLRKELYTKSKDKYDILYNNEVFMNIENRCDSLLNKVNAKVVDIKKENSDNRVNEKSEYLKRVLLRFQDMAKARGIILKSNIEEFDLKSIEKLVQNINILYDNYIFGVNESFNYSRNKDKTELVILFNGINKIICGINNEQFISIEHINFRLNDLLEAVSVKKNELELLFKEKYHIPIDNSIVNDKIEGLMPKDMINKKNKVLKKDIA